MKTLLTLALFLTTSTYLKAQWYHAFPTYDISTKVGVDQFYNLWTDQYGYLISGINLPGPKVYGITLKSSDLINWTTVDTTRNDNAFLSIVRFDTTHVIAVTDTKVKKSYQNGKNWVEKDTLPKNGSDGIYINLLQINSTTALLSSTNYLYRTTDKGETWQKLISTDHLGRLFRKGNFIYSIRSIGTTYTIAKSKNDGNTWQYSPSISIPFNSIHFQNMDTVYAYAYKVGIIQPIYRSYDGGNTFNLKDTLHLPEYGARSVYFINNRIGFINTGSYILYKSCDGGTSWVENSNVFMIDKPNQFFFINDTLGIALAHRLDSYGGYVTWNQGGACPPMTGITKNEQKEGVIIKVYPNPTSGSFTVTNGSSKDMQIILYDALGRILLSTDVEAQSEKTLSLHLPPAIYFMKSDNGFNCKLVVKE